MKHVLFEVGTSNILVKHPSLLCSSSRSVVLVPIVNFRNLQFSFSTPSSVAFVAIWLVVDCADFQKLLTALKRISQCSYTWLYTTKNFHPYQESISLWMLRARRPRRSGQHFTALLTLFHYKNVIKTKRKRGAQRKSESSSHLSHLFRSLLKVTVKTSCLLVLLNFFTWLR